MSRRGVEQSGSFGRRVQVDVYYTDSFGRTHSVKVRSAIQDTNNRVQVEIEPDEEWKQRTLHEGISFELSLIGLELDRQVPIAHAVRQLCNALQIHTRAAERTAEKVVEETKRLRRRWLVRLSLWFFPEIH